ncbi:bifunctional (p)ppGpp synthetase/guanosine-3',5'-bis(diphosphate) 3'-pyrophosphohydrolase [Paucibacter sp. hw1]|uniref:GTP pyrophosphokinase n=2 Tax=Roseateles koreensis TaxID=2987526 RepID=A0ABT5KMV8_9BURK|nr:bifunctional (p)ppGpp synthetase/guanosine-3',5'-bis(diphosphate) 3'-pyrophosphohydrolase [Roseateles koreensis]MDC8783790.1 bifunctional (p)ppGpp synthetase/guanosine-3',5'-bis(diphosphate) 3'-pyrophosphohydrolase [Roseateles koreensis]
MPSPAAAPLGRDAVARARAFAEPLLMAQALDTGEEALVHADGVAAILAAIGAAPSMQAAAYLVYAGDYLNKPEEVVAKAFGESYASLVTHTRRLVQIQRAAREAKVDQERRSEQTERVRKMLLAFSRDLRVVLLRLASRLQTLRFFAQSKRSCPANLALESQQVFAPLANRLGIWQIKWEIEDLSFRFLQPQAYRDLARALDETRVAREQGVESARADLQAGLRAQGIAAQVQGRPKHLYSIYKKMQGKGLTLARVFDLRALRVIVPDLMACYATLSWLHEAYTPVAGEFDDYIARPKPNGYQSLHTVVLGADGRATEVQIRTQAMHDHAEHGVAAHWAYKEAGARGYAGVSAAGEFEDQVAQARKAVLRQLLAWERDLAHGATEEEHADSEAKAARGDGLGAAAGAGSNDTNRAASEKSLTFDDRIYVFTPQATIVELTAGASPIDFAYAVHTDLGHRCRGAKVDGQIVPLGTPLQSGQTVEITAAKEGGPSLDWLHLESGYLRSPRSRAKVRAWFNAQAQAQTIARGREAVEKLLQREGRTAIKLEDLAGRLGFKNADALFELVGKDEYSLRNIEQLLRPTVQEPLSDELLAQRMSKGEGKAPRGGVLVVGVDSLLTNLARCCRPAPPDQIGGYVTRGKGVAIHRCDCINFRQMAQRSPERVIDVTWGGDEVAGPKGKGAALYPVDVIVESSDRQGLLRDVLEVLAKEKMNVIAVNTQSVKQTRGETAWMNFTVEVADSGRLAQVLRSVTQVPGVRAARRK